MGIRPADKRLASLNGVGLPCFSWSVVPLEYGAFGRQTQVDLSQRTSRIRACKVAARSTAEGGPRFQVRQALDDELYVVADIRVCSFYDDPADASFVPTRRREIYLKLRKRVHSVSTTTHVVVDTAPPDLWRPFAIPPNTGQLLVGSLDAFLFDAQGRGMCPPSSGESDRYYISSMAIRKEFRRFGLGKQLLTKVLEEEAPRLGVHWVYLHVDPENKAAYTLYRSQGFELANESEKSPKWLLEKAKSTDCLLKRKVG